MMSVVGPGSGWQTEAGQRLGAMAFWNRLAHSKQLLREQHRRSDLDSLRLFQDEVACSLAEIERELSMLPAGPFDANVAYSLKISLKGTRVWRRLHVPNLSLLDLHYVIQVAFGWSDAHLHGFTWGDCRIPLVEEGAGIDERSVSVGSLWSATADAMALDEPVPELTYVYHRAAPWEHKVSIEQPVLSTDEFLRPRCMGGFANSPPEDVGGPVGYARLIAAANLEEADRDELDWELIDYFGRNFDPSLFQIDTINRRLEQTFRSNPRRWQRAS